LWILRSNAVGAPHFRLIDLVRLDERVEANVDGLRVAEQEGWKLSLAALADHDAGTFFTAASLAIERGDPASLELVINAAVEGSEDDADRNGLAPWRGIASAIAWANQSNAMDVIDRLLGAAPPRLRWLAVGACGCRRATRHTNWELA